MERVSSDTTKGRLHPFLVYRKMGRTSTPLSKYAILFKFKKKMGMTENVTGSSNLGILLQRNVCQSTGSKSKATLPLISRLWKRAARHEGELEQPTTAF